LIRDRIHRCDVDVATIFGKLFPSEAIIGGAVMVVAQLVAHQAAMTSARAGEALQHPHFFKLFKVS
jgi:hypothetical protein